MSGGRETGTEMTQAGFCAQSRPRGTAETIKSLVTRRPHPQGRCVGFLADTSMTCGRPSWRIEQEGTRWNHHESSCTTNGGAPFGGWCGSRADVRGFGVGSVVVRGPHPGCPATRLVRDVHADPSTGGNGKSGGIVLPPGKLTSRNLGGRPGTSPGNGGEHRWEPNGRRSATSAWERC